MRVGILCHSSLGGSAHVAVELAVKLADRGHRLHLFARKAPFGLRAREKKIHLHFFEDNGRDQVPSPTLDSEWCPDEVEALVTRVLRIIDSEGLDVLHFHYAVPFAAIAAEVKRRAGPGRPLIVGTLHGTDVSNYGRQTSLAPRLLSHLLQADTLTAVSTNLAALATDVFGLENPPHIIPNFVDTALFRPGQNHRQDRGARLRPRIAHVSNFRA